MIMHPVVRFIAFLCAICLFTFFWLSSIVYFNTWIVEFGHFSKNVRKYVTLAYMLFSFFYPIYYLIYFLPKKDRR
jgi:hypothetical protein